MRTCDDHNSDRSLDGRIHTCSDADPDDKCDDTRSQSDIKQPFCRLVCDVLCLGFGLLRFLDRKSTRLNSSHVSISYAVFCLKKKNWRSGATYGSNTENYCKTTKLCKYRNEPARSNIG